ncbi:MAG: hypothetical protein JXA33_08710, partial [Anaerolineae bacterium]|nr:hypothetical protein [Anaerolineae bacterium]
TEFVYNGLGARVALSVTGTTTRYTLDYAANSRILAETTPTETVRYLYGHDCLGEFRDDELALSGAEGWLYYLPDAEGYVRQGADTGGAVVSAWLFDPDGTVLEGPNGPVSHLICGGVYDWSTGLLYKGGRYFDPMLGIWLALLPLIVIQGRKKKRKGGHSWMMLLCVGLLVTGTLTACDDCSPPIQETPLPDAFTGCTVILACGMGTGANCKNEIPLADYSDQVPLQPLKDEFVKLGGEYKYLDYDTYGAKGDYARAIKTDIATSGDRVYMVGHSAGADAVIWAASELIDEGAYTQVKAIAILDSALLTGDGSGLNVDDWETRRDTQDAADDVAKTIPMWAGHSRQGKNASSFPRVDPRMGCQYSQGHLDLAVNAEAATQIINFFGQHP